jgi:hypothetical protein
MAFWDDLGFDTNYTVDADPEYPGDGEWRMPVVELSGGASLPTPGPVAVLHPAVGEPWVLSVGFSGLCQLFGSPDPDTICVVERFARFAMINVHTREQREQVGVSPVHVAAAPEFGLLLVAGHTSITAIGLDGIRWTAGGLVDEDIHITRSDGDRVYFRGLTFDGESVREVRGSIDARTGEAGGAL